MRVADFDYPLPDELIAQYPLNERSASRLLVLDGASGAYVDRTFTELPALLRSGDILVFNDTRVIPARLFGRKPSGGRVEIMVERLLDTRRLLAHIRASIAPKPGSYINLDQDIRAVVVSKQDDLYEVTFDDARPVSEIVQAIGHMPLPPYIHRTDDTADRERYQTVYARKDGAVAAPTAGLHFDQAMLDRLSSQGIVSTFVTLHVGAGTFQPVRVEALTDHRMHAEYVEVSAQTCTAIERARAAGGRVIAVGTTSVRSLEAAAQNGSLQAYSADTRIFIYPGYTFKVVDAMLTNFHLPRSTLLMLLCAFGGYQNTMRAYHHAVEQRYRFFSYGDAMFVEAARNPLNHK